MWWIFRCIHIEVHRKVSLKWHSMETPANRIYTLLKCLKCHFNFMKNIHGNKPNDWGDRTLFLRSSSPSHMDPSHSWVQSHNRLWFQRGPRRQTPPGWCRGLAWKHRRERIHCRHNLADALLRQWQALGGVSLRRKPTRCSVQGKHKRKHEWRNSPQQPTTLLEFVVGRLLVVSCKFIMARQHQKCVLYQVSRHLVAAKTLKFNFFLSESDTETKFPMQWISSLMSTECWIRKNIQKRQLNKLEHGGYYYYSKLSCQS